MKTKQVLTLLLAVIMVASLVVVPVSAAPAADQREATEGNGNASRQTKVDGVVRAPTVIMSIPTEVTLIVNPYKLSVKLPPEASGATPSEASGQILMNDQYVVNLSDANVNVSMNVTGTLPTGIVFSTAPVSSFAATAKLYYLWLETKPIDGTGGSLDVEATRPAVDWSTAYSYTQTGLTKQALLTKSAVPVPLNDVAVLAAADWKTAGATAGEASPDSASYGDITPSRYGWLAFKVLGDCTGHPTEPWTTNDKVTIKLAYTFKLTAAGSTLPASS